MDTYCYCSVPVAPVLSFAIDILVIGHDDLLQQCLDPLLEIYRYQLIPVCTTVATLPKVATSTVAAALINVTMLGSAAYNICLELRNKSMMPIIMTTSEKNIEELVASFEAGADHYLVMPFAAQELEARIQATQRRMSADDLMEYCIIQGDILLNPIKQTARVHDTVIELTTSECRLLQHMMRNPNRAIRTEDLLRLVWGYGSKEDVSVLRTTIHRLRNKIEKQPASPQYLKTIFGIGYRFCPKP